MAGFNRKIEKMCLTILYKIWGVKEILVFIRICSLLYSLPDRNGNHLESLLCMPAKLCIRRNLHLIIVFHDSGFYVA